MVPIQQRVRVSSPPHPLLAHIPLAFNTFAWGLDIMYGLTTMYIRPTMLTLRFNHPATLLDITRLSYFLLCSGLITTIPALLSSIHQLDGLIAKNGGLWEKDSGKRKSVIAPHIKTSIGHALVIYSIFLANLYSWWIRRGSVADGWNPSKTPSTVNLALSIILLPLQLASIMAGESSLMFNRAL